MTASCHRIGSLTIELRLPEEQQARRLMERVSSLRDPRLEDLLQRVFAELSPPDRCDRLEAVEVDLGDLPVTGFDDAFLDRLETSLRQVLARELQGRHPDPPARPLLELLRVFALSGSLPWWAERRDRTLIGTGIRRLLELAPDSWWALVSEFHSSPTALERLAAACDEPTLAALVSALFPPEPRVADALTAPAADLAGERLAALRDQYPPDVTAGLLRLAALGLRGEELLQALLPGSGENATPPSPLPAPPPPGSDPATWLRWLDSLAEFSDAASDGGVPAEVLAALPEPLRTQLAKGWRGEDLRRALAEGHPAPPPLPPAPPPLPPQTPGPGVTSSPLAPAPAAGQRSRLPASPDSDPADPDELAVDDGGLVILWPFLDTLLSRLELMDPEEKVFLAEEARNRAIALFSFLVEGDPDPPPEWRLPLAKVLGGLSPLAPWHLEEPLEPEMLAEGERLLEAVIAHAGLAERMVPEDLRTLVLRRPAVLTSRTGAWLLRVERRAEDALLERLPWGWSWIRLPWMEHPLQVEW
ncbi:contractile injection system tape measure protein [Cyanobium sp. FGCU-6]|nr:contractile injection system tape measure protein [Cyanobium sp. FGCU6]